MPFDFLRFTPLVSDTRRTLDILYPGYLGREEDPWQDPPEPPPQLSPLRDVSRFGPIDLSGIPDVPYGRYGLFPPFAREYELTGFRPPQYERIGYEPFVPTELDLTERLFGESWRPEPESPFGPPTPPYPIATQRPIQRTFQPPPPGRPQPTLPPAPRTLGEPTRFGWRDMEIQQPPAPPGVPTGFLPESVAQRPNITMPEGIGPTIVPRPGEFLPEPRSLQSRINEEVRKDIERDRTARRALPRDQYGRVIEPAPSKLRYFTNDLPEISNKLATIAVQFAGQKAVQGGDAAANAINTGLRRAYEAEAARVAAQPPTFTSQVEKQVVETKQALLSARDSLMAGLSQVGQAAAKVPGAVLGRLFPPSSVGARRVDYDSMITNIGQGYVPETLAPNAPPPAGPGLQGPEREGLGGAWQVQPQQRDPVTGRLIRPPITGENNGLKVLRKLAGIEAALSDPAMVGKIAKNPAMQRTLGAIKDGAQFLTDTMLEPGAEGVVSGIDSALGRLDLVTAGWSGQVLDSVGINTDPLYDQLKRALSPAQRRAMQTWEELAGGEEAAKAIVKDPAMVARMALSTTSQTVALMATTYAEAMLYIRMGMNPLQAFIVAEAGQSAGLLAERTAKARRAEAGRPLTEAEIEEGIVTTQPAPSPFLTPDETQLPTAVGALTYGFTRWGSAIAKKFGLPDVEALLVRAGGNKAFRDKIVNEFINTKYAAITGGAKRLARGMAVEIFAEEWGPTIAEDFADNYVNNRPLTEGVSKDLLMTTIVAGAVSGFAGALEGAPTITQPPGPGRIERYRNQIDPASFGLPVDAAVVNAVRHLEEKAKEAAITSNAARPIPDARREIERVLGPSPAVPNKPPWMPVKEWDALLRVYGLDRTTAAGLVPAQVAKILEQPLIAARTPDADLIPIAVPPAPAPFPSAPGPPRPAGPGPFPSDPGAPGGRPVVPPPAPAPAGPVLGPTPPPKLDDRIDALAFELEGIIKRRKSIGIDTPTPLERLLEVAVGTKWSGPEAAKMVRWATENGYPDVARVIVDRAERMLNRAVKVPIPTATTISATRVRDRANAAVLRAKADRDAIYAAAGIVLPAPAPVVTAPGPTAPPAAPAGPTAPTAPTPAGPTPSGPVVTTTPTTPTAPAPPTPEELAAADAAGKAKVAAERARLQKESEKTWAQIQALTNEARKLDPKKDAKRLEAIRLEQAALSTTAEAIEAQIEKLAPERELPKTEAVTFPRTAEGLDITQAAPHPTPVMPEWVTHQQTQTTGEKTGELLLNGQRYVRVDFGEGPQVLPAHEFLDAPADEQPTTTETKPTTTETVTPETETKPEGGERAIEEGQQPEGGVGEHPRVEGERPTPETGRGDRVVEGGQKPEEIAAEYAALTDRIATLNEQTSADPSLEGPLGPELVKTHKRMEELLYNAEHAERARVEAAHLDTDQVMVWSALTENEGANIRWAAARARGLTDDQLAAAMATELERPATFRIQAIGKPEAVEIETKGGKHPEVTVRQLDGNDNITSETTHKGPSLLKLAREALGIPQPAAPKAKLTPAEKFAAAQAKMEAAKAAKEAAEAAAKPKEPEAPAEPEAPVITTPGTNIQWRNGREWAAGLAELVERRSSSGNYEAQRAHLFALAMRPEFIDAQSLADLQAIRTEILRNRTNNRITPPKGKRSGTPYEVVVVGVNNAIARLEKAGAEGIPATTTEGGGAAPAGGPERTPGRRPRVEKISPEEATARRVRAQAERIWPEVLADAQKYGFSGNAEALKVLYNERVEQALSYVYMREDLEDAHGPKALIKAIIGYGGLRPYDVKFVIGLGDVKTRGEFESMVQGFNNQGYFGARSPFRDNGMELDGILDQLHQGGEWPEFRDTIDLHRYLEKLSDHNNIQALSYRENIWSAMGFAGVIPGEQWWIEPPATTEADLPAWVTDEEPEVTGEGLVPEAEEELAPTATTPTTLATTPMETLERIAGYARDNFIDLTRPQQDAYLRVVEEISLRNRRALRGEEGDVRGTPLTDEDIAAGKRMVRNEQRRREDQAPLLEAGGALPEAETPEAAAARRRDMAETYSRQAAKADAKHELDRQLWRAQVRDHLTPEEFATLDAYVNKTYPSGLHPSVWFDELKERGIVPFIADMTPFWQGWIDDYRKDPPSTGAKGIKPEDIKPAHDPRLGRLPPATVDVLDTGEVQPRLPGETGAVREQEVATPEEEVPFSLTGQVSTATDALVQDLFGPTANPVMSGPVTLYGIDAIQTAFNLTREQAETVDALVRASGIDTSRISIVRGGTPGDGALHQEGNILNSLPYAPARYQNGRLMVSVTVPTAAGRPRANELLFSDLDRVKQDTKTKNTLLDRLATRFSNYPQVRPAQLKEGSSEKVVNAFLDITQKNLRFLWDAASNDWGVAVRDRAMRWYWGAHRIARQIAANYGLYDEQAAAVVAVLSPGRDWYENVELAQRIPKWVREFERTNPVFSKALYAEHSRIIWATTEADLTEKLRDGEITEAEATEGRARVTQLLAQDQKVYEGRHWKTLPLYAKARMLRAADQADPQTSRIVSPEGAFGPIVTLKGTDNKPTTLRWASYRAIQQALSIIEDGTPENITEQLGAGLKVRSFFNNISNPDNPRSVTIDSHAVAAALLQPVTQSSSEYEDASGRGGSTVLGITGANPVYQEAYIRLAAQLSEELGRTILPHQVQAVVWTVERQLFPAGKKRRKASMGHAEGLWRDYSEGKITLDALQSQIYGTSAPSGLVAPNWTTIAENQGGIPWRDVRAGVAGVPSGPGSRGQRAQKPAGQNAAEPDGLVARHRAPHYLYQVDRYAQAKSLYISRTQSRLRQHRDPAGMEKVLNLLGLPLALRDRLISEVEVTPRPLTAAFKTWFGDSKVVDDKGQPLMVFHGSKADFTEFKAGRGRTGEERREGWGSMQRGIYFSPDPSGANQYAIGLYDDEGRAVVYPVYLKIERPLVIEKGDKRRLTTSMYVTESDIEAYKEQGYDGIINHEGQEYVVFDSNQIKSATGNRGTFDPSSPNILYQADAPFYSRLRRAVEADPRDRATGAQWQGAIRNVKTGISRDAYVFAGLEDLDADTHYTKQEILDYLDANELTVEPVIFGGPERSFDEELAALDKLGYEIQQDSPEEPPYLVQRDPMGGPPIVIEESTSDWADGTTWERAASWEGRGVAVPLSERALARHSITLRVAKLWDSIVKKDRYNREHTAQYDTWTLGGPQEEGTYREVSLTVPFRTVHRTHDWQLAGRRVKELEAQQLAYIEAEVAKQVEGNLPPTVVEVPKKMREELREAGNALYYAKERAEAGGNWQDGHSNYDMLVNPIVRVRFNIRPNAAGQRVLFIEEMQAPQTSEFEKMPRLFQQKWRDIGFKWALRYAAENGLDGVAWTTGQTQVDRYGIEKIVDQIDWERHPTGTRHINVRVLGRHEPVRITIDPEGIVTSAPPRLKLTDKSLTALLPKKIVAQILRDESDPDTMERRAEQAENFAKATLKTRTRSVVIGEARTPSMMTTYWFEAPGGRRMTGEEKSEADARSTLEWNRKHFEQATVNIIQGEGLKVFGEGLKQLYDVDFGRTVNALPVVKRAGIKVGTTDIPLGPHNWLTQPMRYVGPEYTAAELRTLSERSGPDPRRFGPYKTLAEHHNLFHPESSTPEVLRRHALGEPGPVLNDDERAQLRKAARDMDRGAEFQTALRENLSPATAGAIGGRMEAIPASERPNVMTAPGFLINPSLRDAVLGGDYFFQGAKGQVEFTKDGMSLLRAFATADLSTFVHEFGHIMRHEMLNRAVEIGARYGITDIEIDTVEKWAGVENGIWTRDAEEKFARGFERYIRDGKAPVPVLQAIFDKLARWMTAIYQEVQGSDIDIEISDEVRAVFDKMVTRGLTVEAAPAPTTPTAAATTEVEARGPPEPPTARQPVIFRSGAGNISDIQGFIQAGQPVGVVALQFSTAVREAFQQYVRDGGHVFFDSGAYNAFTKKLPPPDFTKVLAQYLELVRENPTHAAQYHFVAPDAVGNATESQRLQHAHAEGIRELLALGANVIVPTQVFDKGHPQTTAALAANIAEVVERFPKAIIGLPGNKKAVSFDQLRAVMQQLYTDGVTPRGFHFLGIGANNPQFDRFFATVYEVFPDAELTSDSNRIRAMFGKGRPASVDVEEVTAGRARVPALVNLQQLHADFYEGKLSGLTSKEQKDIIDTINRYLSRGGRMNVPITLGAIKRRAGQPEEIAKFLDEHGVDPRIVELALHEVTEDRARTEARPGTRTDVIAAHDVKTEQLAKDKEAIRAKREELRAQVGQRLNRLHMGAPIDPKTLQLVIEIVGTYVEEGIVTIKQLIRRLQRDGLWEPKLAPYLEAAWEVETGETVDVTAVAQELEETPRAEGEQPAAGEGPVGVGGRPGGLPGGVAGEPVLPPTGERPPDVVAPEQPGEQEAVQEPGGESERPARAAAADDRRGLTEENLVAYNAAERSPRFSPYRLRTRISGLRHPRVMVEARALAGVEYPDLDYVPTPRFEHIIADGRASIEQGEQAMAAVQANMVGKHGYLAADNVGVGKAREAWLVAIEMMERAKDEGKPMRLLFTTKSRDNITNLIEEELPKLLGGKAPGFKIVRVSEHKASKGRRNEPHFQPKALPTGDRVVYLVDFHNLADYRQSLLGAELNGIIGDEAHRFKNVEEAAVGQAWQALHAHIFKNIDRDRQVFAYFTATPAQAVEDFEYLYGLRIWPVDGFNRWIQMVTGELNEQEAQELQDAAEGTGGFDLDAVINLTPGTIDRTSRGDAYNARITPAESEQITREWKRRGRFSSRDLWREGTEFVIQTEVPTQEALDKYDDYTELARGILNAEVEFAPMNSGRKTQIGNMNAQLQFAAKRVQLDPALVAAIRRAEEALRTGHQVVLSIMNVSEFDPKQGNVAAAIDMINEDEVRIVDGTPTEPIKIAEAVERKQQLRRQAAAFGSLPSPIQVLTDHFGADNIAFVIGENVTDRDSHVREYQNGQRKIAVISSAGSTGINLDHRVLLPPKDVNFNDVVIVTIAGEERLARVASIKADDTDATKDQLTVHYVPKGRDADWTLTATFPRDQVRLFEDARGRRVFIDLQYEWSASEAAQRIGRVDRSSQISSPRIEALNFGSPAEKKFLSTIANRMSSLGALSRGGAETASDLEEFEIQGPDSLQAARNVWNALPDRDKMLFIGSQFRDPNNRDLPATHTRAPVKKIMFGLLLVPHRVSQPFWEAFIIERDRIRNTVIGAERRTRATSGEVLRTIRLTPNLVLHQVQDGNGSRFGILTGVIMPEMPTLRNYLYAGQTGVVQRRYISFTTAAPNAHTQPTVISGLEVNWNRIPPLAAAYGKKLEDAVLDTPGKVYEALHAGQKVPLRYTGSTGKPWILRMRNMDGKITIDGVLKSEIKLVQPHGAVYWAAGDWFEVRDLAKFLQQYPTESQALTEEEDEGDDEGGAASRRAPTERAPRRERVEARAAEATTTTMGIPPGPGPTVAIPAVMQGGPVPIPFTEIRPMEMPELILLARALIGDPRIVKRFRKAGTLGMFGGSFAGVRLHAGLFKPGMEVELAAVLAHELGHVIDWLPDHIDKRGNIIGRLYTLRKFMNATFTTPRGVDISNKAIREELLALTMEWNPWNPDAVPESYNKYRRSGKELYAEGLSALLSNPAYAEQKAPTFFKEFLAALDTKPEVKEAYFKLQELLSGNRPALIADRLARDRAASELGNTTSLELQKRHMVMTKERQRLKLIDLQIEYLDRNYAVIDKARRLDKQGRPLPESKDPRYFLEERNYLGGQILGWLKKNIEPVYREVLDAGIDWHSFGLAMLYERVLEGDRYAMANPNAGSPSVVKEKYDLMKSMMTPRQIQVLRRTLDAWRGAYREVIEKANQSGLYTKETWKQMEENPAYGTFRVIEHMTPGMSHRIFEQYGTTKEIDNVADATLLKALATIYATEHNNVKRSVFNMLSTYYPSDIQDANVEWVEKGGHRHSRPLEPGEKERLEWKGEYKGKLELVKYWDQGQLKGKYVDNYIAASLENDAMAVPGMVTKIFARMNSGYFRPVFTMLNLGFQSFNVVRDFIRFWKNVPDMTVRKAVKLYWDAVPLAKVRAFGLPNKPTQAELKAWDELADAEHTKVLGITFRDYITGRDLEDRQIEDILARYGHGQFKAAPWSYEPTTWLGKKAAPLTVPGVKAADVGYRASTTLGGATKLVAGRWTPPQGRELGAKTLHDWLENVADFVETLPKGAAISEYKGPGSVTDLTPAQRSQIRRKVGSPDFLMGGTKKPIFNEYLLFSNAIIQATRADWEVIKHPTTRSGWMYKTLKVNVLPKIPAMVGLLLGPGDDDWPEWVRNLLAYRKISEYDLTHYNNVIIGWDSQGNAIYLRFPQDDSGRFVGGLVHKAFQAGRTAIAVAKGQQPWDYRDVLDIVGDFFTFTAGQAPAIQPLISGGLVTLQYALNQNPYDALRSKPIFSDVEWEAGGAQGKFIGWQFQHLGGGIIWKFFPGDELPKKTTIPQTLVGLPIVSNIPGRWIRVSRTGERELLSARATRQARGAATDTQEMRGTINKAIGDYHGLQPWEQTDEWRIEKAREITDTLYPEANRSERTERVQQISKALKLGIRRGEADPATVQLIAPGSLERKAAILEGAREMMTPKQYEAWYEELRDDKLISKALHELMQKKQSQKELVR